MKSTLESLDDNKVKLSIEVDESEFEQAIDAAFSRIAKEVRLPGFRPGKAPRKVLEARLGAGFARGEALRDALPEYYYEAVREHDVDIIAQPDFDITAGQEDGPLAFDAVVEVRPVINVAGYDGLRVEVTSPTATDEEIDEQIDALRGQFAELATVSNPAIDHNHVTIDIHGTYQDEPVEGLTADDYVYEVGTGTILPEIDEQLRGSKAGDILEFDAAHPSEEEDGELHFRVLVKDVQEKVLPDLDDAFVAEASEFETVEELRQDIAERIGNVKRSQAEQMRRERTAAGLAGLVEIEPPSAMVDAEVQTRIQDFALRLRGQGADIDQYLTSTGRTAEQLLDELREPAAQAVLVDLALRSVADAEGIEVTDADIDEELDNFNRVVGSEDPVTRQQFEESGQIRVLSTDLRKRKAMDLVLATVEAVDDAGRPIDRALFEAPDPETETETETDPETETETANPPAVSEDPPSDDAEKSD